MTYASIDEAVAELRRHPGESMDELMSRLREAREAGGSAEPPEL